MYVYMYYHPLCSGGLDTRAKTPVSRYWRNKTRYRHAADMSAVSHSRHCLLCGTQTNSEAGTPSIKVPACLPCLAEVSSRVQGFWDARHIYIYIHVYIYR